MSSGQCRCGLASTQLHRSPLMCCAREDPPQDVLPQAKHNLHRLHHVSYSPFFRVLSGYQLPHRQYDSPRSSNVDPQYLRNMTYAPFTPPIIDSDMALSRRSTGSPSRCPLAILSTIPFPYTALGPDTCIRPLTCSILTNFDHHNSKQAEGYSCIPPVSTLDPSICSHPSLGRFCYHVRDVLSQLKYRAAPQTNHFGIL